MALAQEVSGVVDDQMNFWGCIRLFGMQALAQSGNQRIDLDRVDLRGPVRNAAATSLPAPEPITKTRFTLLAN